VVTGADAALLAPKEKIDDVVVGGGLATEEMPINQDKSCLVSNIMAIKKT